MTTQPIFKEGDHVLFDRMNQDVPGVITNVYPPSDDLGYRYDFMSTGLLNHFRASGVHADFIKRTPDPVTMAKDLTLREHLIIQFLPECLKLAEANKAYHDRAVDNMAYARAIAGDRADLYLQVRTP